jgi:hypothetical protein
METQDDEELIAVKALPFDIPALLPRFHAGTQSMVIYS